MRHVQQLQQLLRRRELVGNVLQQQPHAERLGEGTQVFDAAHGRVEGALIGRFSAHADVLYQEAERHLLRDLQCTLDFVHRLDAPLALGIGDVDRVHAAAAPLVAVVHRRVHRVERCARCLKPLRNLDHVLAPVAVIEVAAEGEDFDRLGARPHHAFEQARMQPLAHKRVCGHRFQHSQYPSAFPLLRPSGAPSRSPVFRSIMMHSASPQ